MADIHEVVFKVNIFPFETGYLFKSYEQIEVKCPSGIGAILGSVYPTNEPIL